MELTSVAMRALWVVILTVSASVAWAQRPVYSASKQGGHYMWNYYLPPAPSTTPWWPSWSPDGKWIAVAMHGSIWKVDPQTGTAYELTYGRKYHSSPDWSPDGKWIVYTADDGGVSIGLEILNVETGESHTLTQDQAVYADPVFSPDGSRLAYVSTKPNGYFNIYVRRIQDGRWAEEEIALTTDHSFGKERLYFGPWDMHTQPAWMPDGKELLFVSNRDVPLGSGSVWRMPVEPEGMKKARLILQEQTLYRTRPHVSRDGKRFVYASTGGAADEFDNLYILPTTGGAPYKLTFGSYNHFHPRWSPDGEWIAYISNEKNLPQLNLLETHGGAQREVPIVSRRSKRPMGVVRGPIVDASTGKPTAARIYAPAADGKFYAPSNAYARIAHPKMTWRSGDHTFYAEGEFVFEAPPGKMTLEAVKGFEYWPIKQEIEVKAGETAELVLNIKRMVDMPAKGWYSGTTHTHPNKGGNQNNTLEDVMAIGRAEDLRVVTPLVANKDNRIIDREHWVKGGGEHPVSRDDPNMIVLVGQEFRPPLWGHVFYVGLKDHLISPFTNGYEGTALESFYPSNTDMFRKAKAQGAVVGYAHSFGGSGDPLRSSLGGGKGFAVDLALGTVDALEWASSSRASLLVWHHALNNDFRLTPVGGEDAKLCFQRQTLVGSVRTYAYLGNQFTAAEWLRALKEGRTFLTTGPLVEFSVNQQIPGEAVNLPPQGGTITLEGRVWSYLPVTRMIVYHNGNVWKEIPLTGDKKRGEFREQLKVGKSGWFSLVAEGPGEGAEGDSTFPQAITNAIRVYVGDQKIRNRESAEYFVQWIDRLRVLTEKSAVWRSQAEKDHVFSQFEEARRVYERLAMEAGQAAPALPPTIGHGR